MAVVDATKWRNFILLLLTTHGICTRDKQTKYKLNSIQINWSAQKSIHTRAHIRTPHTANRIVPARATRYVLLPCASEINIHYEDISESRSALIRRWRDDDTEASTHHQSLQRNELNKYVKPTSPLKPLPHVAINANEIHARLSNILFLFSKREKRCPSP